MKEEVRNLLESFLDKPTEANLQLLNDSAKAYTAYWIENIHSLKNEEEEKPSKKKRKSLYRRKYPKDLGHEGEGWYIALQERLDDPENPFWVISFRQTKYVKKDKTRNRRFYYQLNHITDQPEYWRFEEDYALDTWLGPLNDGWFDFEDHRRPKDIPIDDQFIHSGDLDRDQKISYLKDMVFEGEIVNPWVDEAIPGVDENQEEKRTFIDAVDDLDFCIDLYAGDASGGGDGKDWRKVFISYDRTYYTIRGLTLDQNYSMSKLIQGSDWRIDNSMPDISPQTAAKFWQCGFF
tara:strand:- start:442 stop:1317 length:876 start_codon:yes stop_codon:yes gene_type:complete